MFFDLLIMEAELYAVSLGIASKKKHGEKVCGDCISYFKTDDGFFYVILSDGVGSGEDAARKSSLLIQHLEKFIISGTGAERAIKLVEAMFLFNGSELIQHATLDLLEINLYNGTCRMYKIGAMPTYLNNSRNVTKGSETIFSVGYDLCYEELHIDTVSLSSGSVLIMTSDGVSLPQKKELYDLVKKERSMKMLARSIVMYSVKEYGCDDDMSVVTVSLEYRS